MTHLQLRLRSGQVKQHRPARIGTGISGWRNIQHRSRRGPWSKSEGVGIRNHQEIPANHKGAGYTRSCPRNTPHALHRAVVCVCCVSACFGMCVWYDMTMGCFVDWAQKMTFALNHWASTTSRSQPRERVLSGWGSHHCHGTEWPLALRTSHIPGPLALHMLFPAPLAPRPMHRSRTCRYSSGLGHTVAPW